MSRPTGNGIDYSASLLAEQHDPDTAATSSPVAATTRHRVPQPSGSSSFTDDGGISTSSGASAADLQLLRTDLEDSSFSLSDPLPRSPTSRSPSAVVLSQLKSRARILWCHFVLLILVALYGYTEQTALTGATDPLLPASSILSLNNLTHPLFPNRSIASNATHRTRVVYFIIDGLRSDAVTTSTALSALLTSLQPHVAVRSTLAQLPSISLPNWLTLATGVTPSLHGHTGNDVVEEVGWSSVWSESLHSQSPNGVAGHGWWSTMFRSQLTPWTGDGTVTDFVNYGDHVFKRGASEVAVDAEYNRNFHRAIQSRSGRYGREALFDYEMFVAYYCDVDGESHSFGAHSSEAQQAIADKTAYIRDAIAAIEAADRINAANGVHFRTTYVITADHGHIDVGGHGGDAEVIRSIPLIFYANHSYLSDLTAGTGNGTADSPVSQSRLPPQPSSYSPSNVDIATTVSALAGVRVPRESEGMFVSDVLGALIGADNVRAYLHYADLFVQKRALARELLSVLGQSTSSELLDDSNDATLLPQPATNLIYSALIVTLNNLTGELVQLIERAKASHLSSQLAASWALSTLFLLLVLLPLLAWVYSTATFLCTSAVLPGRLASLLASFSYFVRNSLVRCFRAVGGHTRTPARYSTNYSTASLRLNRTTCAISLAMVLLWLLLMLFQFNVLFRYGYRSTPMWRWQFTLFNSTYDAYVLVYGFCLFASLVTAAIIHLLVWSLLRLPAVSDRVFGSWLSIPLAEDEVLSQSTASLSVTSHASSFGDSRAVALYHIVMYSSVWASLLLVLFLFAQSYHCFYLPFVMPLSSVLTAAIWTARFQSLTLSFMLLPAYLYLGCVVWWQQWRLWSGLAVVAVVERKGEHVQWLEDKRRTVLLLVALRQSGD